MNAPATIQAPQNVFAKIAAVQGELAKVGIAKGRRNQQQGYNFRGIDEVYAALSPLLARHGLVIIPRVVSRECVERASARGGALFNVTVHAEFDFVSADDGSIHTAATFGEAMDSADKATNKAMSAAYKYAAFMTFAIPTEGDNDADAQTHEVAAPKATRMPDNEWAKLVQLIEAAKADRSAMLGYFKVKDLRDLTSAQCAEAIELLNTRLAKLAKEQSNAKAPGFGEVLADEIPY